MTVDPRSADDLEVIRRRMDAADSALQRDRYRVVLLALEGYFGPELTRDQMARIVGRSRQFVDEWTGRYRRGGVEALVAGKSSGRPPALDAEQLARFKQRIKAGPTDADAGVCALRGRDARRVLESEFGKALTLTEGTEHYESYTLVSSYDKNGNRSKVVYPDTGRVLISTYDLANRMVQLEDSVTSIQPSTFDYDPAGNRKRFRAPNGVVTDTTFDAANRVLTHTATSDNGNGTVIYDLTHAYNKAGNRLSKTIDPDVGSTLTTNYTYDDLNQLLSSTGDEAATYTHDLNGNRVTKTVGADTTTYVYDVSDRLIEAKDDNNDTIFTATYDARTRRLTKTEGASTKMFRYDGGTNFQELTPGTPADNANPAILGDVTTELIRAGTSRPRLRVVGSAQKACG